MARKRFEAEQKNATEVATKGIEITATLNHLLAESLAAEQEEIRLVEEHAVATKEKNKGEAARLRLELKAKHAEEKERDKRITEAKKAEEKAAKEETKKEETAKQKEERLEKKAAKNWLAYNETLVSKLNRTLSEGDSLYAELKAWKNNKRTTEEQRTTIAKALYSLGARVEDFNPQLSSAKGGTR